MSTVFVGSPQRYDPIYRRGAEFYDEVTLSSYNADGSMAGVNLNGATILAEIHGSSDIDSPVISALTVVPIDLSEGHFGFYQTTDETEAFVTSPNAGSFFLTVHGTVTAGVRLMVYHGTLEVQDGA